MEGEVSEVRKALYRRDRQAAEALAADGFTALHFAAYLGGAEAVRALIEAGSDVGAVARNDMQAQPLHSAAAIGDVEACRLLLEAGGDPNAAQNGGWTPLDEAIITKNEPRAALLRDHGGRVSGNALPD